jgi:hypothetical protein
MAPALTGPYNKHSDQNTEYQEMKKALLSLLLALCASAATAGVITFDDLPGDGNQMIAGAYHGLNWGNVGTVSQDLLPGSGYANGTVSPANTAFNWDGGTVTISKATAGTFNFVGAYFTSAWMDQELSFEGLRNGQIVYATDVSTVIDTLTPIWVQLGWSGIDTLVIYNSSGTQWAMDNFTVPEPTSMALFGVALAGLMLISKRTT